MKLKSSRPSITESIGDDEQLESELDLRDPAHRELAIEFADELEVWIAERAEKGAIPCTESDSRQGIQKLLRIV